MLNIILHIQARYLSSIFHKIVVKQSELKIFKAAQKILLLESSKGKSLGMPSTVLFLLPCEGHL